MKRVPKQKALFRLYMLILFIPCLELAFRLVGYRPYEQNPFQIESQPAFCLLADPYLGFSLRPGTFEVCLNNELAFKTSHGRDSLRISSYKEFADSLPQIFVMGCSYTYGWGLNDRESFSFLLQEAFPAYKMRNFGVPGYGTVQSYLQLKREIRKGNIPTAIIINYADFHADRNVLSPIYRKHLYMGYQRSNEQVSANLEIGRIPYLAESGDRYQLSWISWKQMYTNWKGRESLALVNFLQEGADRIASQQVQSTAASLYVFARIRDLCEINGIRLWVSGLTCTAPTQDFLSQLQDKQIETLDIALDLSLPQFSLHPFDSHPNARAHQHYASMLQVYLDKELRKMEE